MMVIKHSLMGSPYLEKPVKVPFFGGLVSRHDGHQALAHGKSAEQEDVCWLGDWDGPETLGPALVCC